MPVEYIHTGPKWYPVILRDESAVDLLNALFDRGWYLPAVRTGDAPNLIFRVPASTLRDSAEHQMQGLREYAVQPMVPMALLTRDDGSPQQMALKLHDAHDVLYRRDSNISNSLQDLISDVLGTEHRDWTFITLVTITKRLNIVILEKRNNGGLR